MRERIYLPTSSAGTPTITRPDGGIVLWSCVAFAVGTMVGAGVFVLSGLAVKQAGPAALASFVLAGVLVLLSALSFTVVASRARQGSRATLTSGAPSVDTGGSSRSGRSTSAA